MAREMARLMEGLDLKGEKRLKRSWSMDWKGWESGMTCWR